MSKACLQLSHEEPLTGTLFPASLMFYDLSQIGHRFGILTRTDEVVSMRIVPVFHCTIVHRVALHVPYHVLRLIQPPKFHIAFCQPSPCNAVDMGTCLKQAAHIREGSSSLFKLALLELRLTQQQPSLPDERVILSAIQPFYVLCSLLALLVPLRTSPDTMTADGFLRFLDGTVKLPSSNGSCLFVAYGV